MKRTDQLSDIIQVFCDAKLHEGEERAERMELSLRTNHRDIETSYAQCMVRGSIGFPCFRVDGMDNPELADSGFRPKPSKTLHDYKDGLDAHGH